MFKILTIAVLVAATTGCASTNYSEYINAQRNIELAQAQAEAERYKAMAEIAKNGDTATQVAAMMSMQSQGAIANRPSNVVAPKSTLDEVKEWASILVPSLTQITINGQNTDANMHNSDNNRITAIVQSEQDTIRSTNTTDAFVNIAGEIQAPGANYTDSYNDNSNNSDNSDNSSVISETPLGESNE